MATQPSTLDPRQVLLASLARNVPGGPAATGAGAPPSETVPIPVSPGSPAPVAPGVDIVAPPPQRPVLSVKPPAAPSIGEMADQMTADMRARSLQSINDAEAGARIEPAEQSLFDRQDERIGEDRHVADELKRRNDWDAIAKMGIAMAQSNSPHFGQALAAGLAAGNSALSANRYEAIRNKSILDQRADQIAMAKIQALKAAKAEAVQKMALGQQLTTSELQIAKLTNDQIVQKATSQSTIDTAKAQAAAAAEAVRQAQFQTAHQAEVLAADLVAKRASAAGSYASANANNAQAGYYRAETGKTKAETGLLGNGLGIPKEYVTLRNSLVNQLKVAQLAASDLTVPATQRQVAVGAKAKIEAQIAALDARINMSGTQPPGAPGAGHLDMRDPLGLR